MKQTKSLQTIVRSANYLRYLRETLKNGTKEVSLSDMAQAMNIDLQSLVADIAEFTNGNIASYDIATLIASIEHYLGYDDSCNAVLVGVGNMGSAILSYKGFSDYGIDIVAAFDHDSSVIDTECSGKKILDIRQMYSLCGRMQVIIGILAVPANQAQKVCDFMIACGIKAIWNFAPVKLVVPEDILVQNENIADSLLTLSGRVEQELKSNPDEFTAIPTEFDVLNAIMNKYNRDPKNREQVLREAKEIQASQYGIDYINEVLG